MGICGFTYVYVHDYVLLGACEIFAYYMHFVSLNVAGITVIKCISIYATQLSACTLVCFLLLFAFCFRM